MRSGIKMSRFTTCADTAAENKYNEKYQGMDEIQWENAYSLARYILYDRKIIEMQFKILHRIIGTNNFLFKIGQKASPTCLLCEIQIETLEHLFYECLIVKNFWLKIIDEWQNFKGSELKIDGKHVLLGYIDMPGEWIEENILIMYAK